MHAFDFIMLLFSFVYAAAVVHFLATLGDLIIASKRVRFSWFNAGWMATSLIAVIAWWVGSWDLHTLRQWDVPTIFVNFAAAALLYILARLVCPRVPHEGEIDLQAFHREEGRKYIGGFVAVCVATIIYNFVYGLAPTLTIFLWQNIVIAPMAVTGVAALIWMDNRRVQTGALIASFGLWVLYFTHYQKPLAD